MANFEYNITSDMKKVIVALFATLLGFGILFMSFQSHFIYSKTLGLVANNWQNDNGERKLINKPYDRLTNENYIQWDGVHYLFIKNNGYNVEKAGGDYIFAFFPLFPFVWKLTCLPPIGILFLNYIFLSISIIILLRLFSHSKQYLQDTLISLSLPSIIIFFIPYTESTFLLMLSIGIYGFVRKKYWIFFAGLLLASLARPSYALLALSIIAVEFFYVVEHRNLKLFIKSTFLRTLPLIVGTAFVSLIQYLQGSGSIFRFLAVQKYWNNVLAVPHNLRDWSQEGFSINIGVVVLIFVPLLMIIAQQFHNQLRKEKTLHKFDYDNPKDYLVILSVIYLIANVLFIILFRGGSLNCLFRFTLCSPFPFILLFGAFPYIKQVPSRFRFFMMGALAMLSIFILGLSDYSTYWNFSDLGLFILIGALLAWTFQDFKANITYKVGLGLLFIVNLIWTTYLFNTYIANGWIFA